MSRLDAPQNLPALIGRSECERTHEALDKSLDQRLDTVSDTQRELRAAVETMSSKLAELTGQVIEMSKAVAVLLTRKDSRIVATAPSTLSKAQWSGIGVAAASAIGGLGKALGWWCVLLLALPSCGAAEDEPWPEICLQWVATNDHAWGDTCLAPDGSVVSNWEWVEKNCPCPDHHLSCTETAPMQIHCEAGTETADVDLTLPVFWLPRVMKVRACAWSPWQSSIGQPQTLAECPGM